MKNWTISVDDRPNPFVHIEAEEVEVVGGMLQLLDEEQNIIAIFNPGNWEWISQNDLVKVDP